MARKIAKMDYLTKPIDFRLVALITVLPGHTWVAHAKPNGYGA